MATGKEDTYCCFLRTDEGEQLASLHIRVNSTIIESALG